jgi:hypothetical protein
MGKKKIGWKKRENWMEKKRSQLEKRKTDEKVEFFETKIRLSPKLCQVER